MSKQFGGKVGEEEIKKYSKSKHWGAEKFNNLEETEMQIPFRAIPKMIYNQSFGRGKLEPKSKLPVLPFDKNIFLSRSSRSKFIWYGHSALLFRINYKTILLDPMLGPNAAPISPFPLKRYNDVSTDLIDDLPEIDLLIMSHDHYDHLDFESMKKLKSKVKKYYVALGVARHLVSWGIKKEDITEFDWWESIPFDDIDITFTPSRHFSGRGLRDRFKGLWGGWVFKTQNENIWFSGDGGYGNHFKDIGEKLGPFDMAFMECGQYNKLWRPIHLFPEDAVRAGKDGQAKLLMPVHWSSFTLSDHHWTEPVKRFTAEASKNDVPFITPRIGELITLGQDRNNDDWWEEY